MEQPIRKNITIGTTKIIFAVLIDFYIEKLGEKAHVTHTFFHSLKQTIT
ncbi:MAG: hypothetical protein ACI9YH_003640 [Colwellia sp.]|jgi:hypothetical protein